MSPAALDVSLVSDPGQERERNEDCGRIVDLAEHGWLLVVCDGMGGHDDGHVASLTAVDTIVQVVEQRLTDAEPFAVLHEAIRHAHVAVTRRAAGTNMGTTTVVAWVKDRKVWYGWVGDSRLYHLRDGTVVERSEDHTRVAILVARGEISPAEARDHPDSGVLIQALGAGMQDVRPTVYTEAIELRDGDHLVLCSDGLHDLVEDHELGDHLQGSSDDIAQRFVDLANARGGHDNITVVVAQPQSNPHRATRPELPPPSPEPRQAEPQPAPAPAPAPAPEPTSPTGFSAAIVGTVFVIGLLLGILIGIFLAPQATPQGSPTPPPATATPATPTPPPTPQATPEPTATPAPTPTAAAP